MVTVHKTSTTLADGRELIYFDDREPWVSGTQTRTLEDPRELPPCSSLSEMRRDPLTGDWVVMAAHRMNRTFMPPANENPLAPTKPGELPTEIPADDYDVVVFENRFPSLNMHMEVGEEFETLVDGFVERAPALGRCEVVCFTADPNSSFRDLPLTRVRTVIEAWVDRTRELSQLPGIRSVFPFENRGPEIGVTLQHPHGQIYSYPFLPPRTRAIVEQAKAYKERTGNDLFQDVIAAEEHGDRVIWNTEHWIGYVPAAAKWPLEIILTPKRKVADFTELSDDEKEELAALYLDILQRVDRFFEGIEKTPYIAAWNQAPVGKDREFGRFHLHLFSLMRSPGRMKYLAGTESAMGAWNNDTTPELIAARLKEVAND
ncbi:galactose-1-phosphate uridylyltransferase [Corynebacterium freiburgense]|uniref:galactose-1-phosphate uridylyltransferase n=1 Tax=Corynebacterium freiburgense TaxID=556548 RepID=UPI00040641EB|nr:galactose-1-phosphate uridylyltransferase [Corynebacterium freiburgense]WJZ02930.1 Galactose-1-phosphate uridylyltransferase [Corynebacterium freiburgense]